LAAAIEKNNAAGTSPPNQTLDVKGKLFEFNAHFEEYMERQALKAETIRLNKGCLRALQTRNADLLNPESVKITLAKEPKWSQNRRRNAINAYTLFLKTNGMQWEKPRCNFVRKIPFIPREQEIDDLIAGCPTKVATFLQLLKETAIRSGEAKRPKWAEVDLDGRVIVLNEPEKNRFLRIWNNLNLKLLNMLNDLSRTNSLVFGDATLNSLKAVYVRARRRLAFKLQNPRLLEIHFHTLRHWKPPWNTTEPRTHYT